MEIERRNEKRQTASIRAGIYLSEGKDGPAISPVLNGQLMSISRRGAGIALPEIMTDRTHLAFEAMDSKTLLLIITLQLDNRESIVLPAKPIWFNKMTHKHFPPFRIGLKFLEPLTLKELNQIIRHFQ